MKVNKQDYDALVLLMSAAMRQLGWDTINSMRKACSSAKSPMRKLVWDIFYRIPYSTRTQWISGVYEYANDDHITTALNRAFDEISYIFSCNNGAA